MPSLLRRMRIHTQLPHPAAASATSSPCSIPQVETMVSVFCNPGAFLSSDNPWDTDCLILPEPNCGRDKERVKDVLPIAPTICVLGNRRPCHCQEGAEPGSRYMAWRWDKGRATWSTHPEPLPHSLPCTRTKLKSSHTLFFASVALLS